MPAPETIRSMLTAGRHRISSGRTAEVVDLVRADLKRALELIECLWDKEPAVAMRAADALEKLTRRGPSQPDLVRDALLALLQRSWTAPLIGLLSETTENKLRWCLTPVLPRLTLTIFECRRVAAILRTCLEDKSSIVKTCAMQGLAELTRQDASLLPEVLDLLRILARSGTPAMRARGRILLGKLETAPNSRELWR
jgi:hypothetical protein